MFPEWFNKLALITLTILMVVFILVVIVSFAIAMYVVVTEAFEGRKKKSDRKRL